MIAMKQEVGRFVELDGANARQLHPPCCANSINHLFHQRRIDRCRLIARQAQQDCSIRRVTVARQSQRAVEVRFHALDAVELSAARELGRKPACRAHRPHRMQLDGPTPILYRSIWEGYGLTETSPVIALNSPLRHRMGAAGRTLSNVELKFAEDGELLVRGPSVLRDTGKSRRRLRSASMRRDGSAPATSAHLDADGFLYITDRKKELLKTSGGKLVAPQPIENKLKNNVLVAQAALVGDRHKFISALISPNFAALEDWAKRHGIQAESRAELVADSRVVALYGEIVREVNGGLANFETLKRFRVVAEEWTQESGELTPSMKLKRRVITARYAAVIDELYADEATARGE